MPKTTEKTRLDRLREEQRALEAKIRDIQTKEKEQSRKDDQRRRLLIGQIIIDFITRHPDEPLTKQLNELIDRQLQKPADRKLFDLADKAKPEK